jgi:hypothetical protein
MRLIPYKVHGRPEYLTIDWPSYWADDVEIEVGLKVVKRKNSCWKVIQLHLPKEVTKEDLEDITSCWWYAFERKSNRKCPPIYMAWEFNSEPAWIVACQQPDDEKQKLFKEQLKEMEEETETAAEKINENLIEEIRNHGPGICTVSSSCGESLEFDITEKGHFAERSFCPICYGQHGRVKDEEITSKLTVLLTSGPAGITIRTFTKENTCVKSEDGKLIRVPIKEIRGYIAEPTDLKDGQVWFRWQKLTLEEVMESYSIDSATGKYIGLTVNKRDHRFV